MRKITVATIGLAPLLLPNAFIEAFNGRFCAECLNAPWLQSLEDAEKKLEDWRDTTQ